MYVLVSTFGEDKILSTESSYGDFKVFMDVSILDNAQYVLLFKNNNEESCSSMSVFKNPSTTFTLVKLLIYKFMSSVLEIVSTNDLV